MELNRILQGDCLESLKVLPDECVDMCVTSPPYFALRDYGVDGQIGLEETPEAYIQRLADVFDEVYRVLKKDDTLWVNIGDSYWGGGWRNADFNEHSGDIQKGSKGTYCGKTMPNLKGNVAGYKNKDLIGIPWMLAFELRKRGWYLRQDIIWDKSGCCMPESVTDRCTKAHEYIFLLSKSPRYYFDYEAIQEPCVDQSRTNYQSGSRTYGENKDRNDNDFGERSKNWKPRTKNCAYDGQRPNSFHVNREMGGKDKQYIVRNKRDVWKVNTKPCKEAHFAVFPELLIAPCILAGSKEGGVVLDPFMGSGTTAVVSKKLGRKYLGCELNPEYIKIAERRLYCLGESLFDF